MFENDRFGPGEDYSRTYQELGGARLTGERLHEILDGLVRHMLDVGRNPLRYDAFPSVSEALSEIALGASLDSEDVSIIEALVARHEAGSISRRHAAAIQRLAATHRLGIVSNIWGRKDTFERILVEAGIFGCFEHAVWSSGLGCIKPSPKLFHHAIRLFNVPASKVLFVGDNPFRDVAAARRCGCSTSWVRNGDEEFPEDCPPPDLVIAHLEELIDASPRMGQRPMATAPS